MIVRVVVVALVAVMAAVLAGHFIAVDPGFMVIGIGGKVIRTTFAFFVIAVLGSVLTLYIVLRLLAHLLALRGRFGRWSGDYRRRRAYRSLADGLLARAAGDHARAERLFSLGADDQALLVGRIEMGLSFEELALVTKRTTPDSARVATRRAALRLARAMGRRASDSSSRSES